MVNNENVSKKTFLLKVLFWLIDPTFEESEHTSQDFLNLNVNQPCAVKLEKAWNDELNCCLNKRRLPSLLKASWKTFKWIFWYCGIYVFIICVILRGLQPYVLGLLIWHFDSRSNSTTMQGCIYAFSLVGMVILQATIGHLSVVIRKYAGILMSVAYSKLIFNKTLTLSADVAKCNTGNIINMLSNDVGKFEDLYMFWHYIWVLPIQGIVMVYFMWEYVGIASLSGIFILVIQTLPVQGFLGNITAKVRAKVAERTDERVRLMSEIINGIEIIKIYVWEKYFEKLVFQARRIEVDAIAQKSYLRGLSTATSAFAESTSLFFVIMTYVLLGNPLEASVIYSLVQYFGMIKTMITVFYPRAISSAAEARVSVERIEILRGNMDGSDLKKVVISTGVVAVALQTDVKSPRVFWADSERIESCDYEGVDRRVVTSAPGGVTSLGVSGGRLFWTQEPQESHARRNLWSCYLESDACPARDPDPIAFDDPKRLKLYIGEEALPENPCREKNGDCAQLCLLSTGGKRTCACYVGFALESNGISCSRVLQFALYTRGNFVKGRILDVPRDAAFSDAIEPIPFHDKVQLQNKPTVDFDYNYRLGIFAFSDDQSVSTLNLLREEPQNAYIEDKCLKEVSYDWATNDVYYVRDNCGSQENASLMLLKPQESSYFLRTLYTVGHNKGHPRAVVVHPNRGGYYFTILVQGQARIYSMRGLRLAPFSDAAISTNETGLSIDFSEDRLYWFSADTTTLYNANFDGGDVRSFDVSIVREPRSVGVFGRYVYVANLTSIWRFDKGSGRGATKIVPRFGDDEKALIGGVKIYAAETQPLTNNNCVPDNGGCQQFCMREPKIVVNGSNSVVVTDQLQKICLCEDFKNVQTDGKSCA